MPARNSRLPFFDTLRGIAMILMAIFHFCFDLNYFGVLHQTMDRSEFWLDFRALIMTLFMGLVGVGLFLGQASWSQRSYRMRLAWIAACALLISVVTMQIFERTWIFFGVLHLALLTSLIGPWVRKWPKVCLIVGALFVALPLAYQSSWWYQPGYIISGLSSIKPFTEDFAPLCPWLGVSLLGIFVGYVARQSRQRAESMPSSLPTLQRLWATEVPVLSRLGHYSLPFYMIHQVVLFPTAWLVSRLMT